MNTKRVSLDIIEIRRMTRMRRLAAGGGLVLALALSGAGAQDSDPAGFFERNPGFAGTRTSLDPFDPFAPSTFGDDSDATGAAGKRGIPAESALPEWDPSTMAPQPGLPGEAY
jgi:hypothetical protein